MEEGEVGDPGKEWPDAYLMAEYRVINVGDVEVEVEVAGILEGSATEQRRWRLESRVGFKGLWIYGFLTSLETGGEFRSERTAQDLNPILMTSMLRGSRRSGRLYE